jgi:AcrR family transcriptional regulator
MAAQRNSTRQRLLNAALQLFSAQGITETTTKQIAELADVNEVTLFRQFGNKHGLLLAVIEETALFAQLGQTVVQQARQASTIQQGLKAYATAYLQALERVPDVVRSVIGEAGQYPPENRQALGRGFTQVNHQAATYFAEYFAEYFAGSSKQGQLHSALSAEKFAGLLNQILLGYAAIEFTSEFHELWQHRDDFLESLITLFLHGAVDSIAKAAAQGQAESAPTEIDNTGSNADVNAGSSSTAINTKVADLPANLVHAILQRAKKLSLQDHAMVYVLFAAGLSPAEVTRLERSHYINDPHQQILQITQGFVRQVPVNQWIMSKRYGSYTRNPLTQWLKSRKDSQTAMFLSNQGTPLSEVELRHQWHSLTEGLVTPDGQLPTLEQTQQTWCVDMLMRGITLEEMQILTGWSQDKLQPYAGRAKQKATLEQAVRLDHKA